MPLSLKYLPNFFIVGAPKAGTTSLYHYLDQHPQIYMSPIKEPNYFASEIRPANFSEGLLAQVGREMQALQEYLSSGMCERRFGGLVSEWQDYLRLFENVKGEKAIGEASVCYLWSKTAAENIASKIPRAKIMMILRNPVDGAFSLYLHAVENGLARKSFREEVQASLRRTTRKFGPLEPFLEVGLYYEQVKRFLEFFPAANVHIYLFDDYQKQPALMLLDIFRFLNVDWSFVPDLSRRHLEARIPKFVVVSYLLKRYGVWKPARKLSPQILRPLLRTAVFRSRKSLVMDPKDRICLLDYYREDVRKLSSLLNRDLTAWSN